MFLSDISIERNTRSIVNSEGNSCTCFYVCMRVGRISGWHVDAHITLFKTYGRPPRQLLDEGLSLELETLRGAFASTPIDGDFMNWHLLYTAQGLPRRALLEIYGDQKCSLFEVRNKLSQRLRVDLDERRAGFHLSVDRVHDRLPREPPLVDRGWQNYLADTIDNGSGAAASALAPTGSGSVASPLAPTGSGAGPVSPSTV